MTSASFGGSAATITVKVAPSAPDHPNEATDEDRASSFAARAVADAGLIDSRGRLFDYLDIRRADDAWTATFENGGCPDESCEAGAQEPLQLTVERLVETYRVAGVEGPVSESERAELLVYQEARGAPGQGWHFPSVEVDDNMGRISGSPVWEGAINALGLGSKCAPVVVSDTGEELWRGDPFDLGPPGAEEERAGENVLFPVLPDHLQDETPEVRCEPWTGRGWTIESSAEAHRRETPEAAQDDRAANIAVIARGRWNGDAFMQAFTKCTATIRDDSGNVVATGVERLSSPPPQAGSERPVIAMRDIIVLARASNPEAARKATIECHAITADEFQGEL